MENWIPIFVILPLASAFLTPILGRIWPFFSKLAILATSAFLTLFCFWIILSWNRQPVHYAVGGWEMYNDIPIGIYLVFDGISGFILGIVNLITLLATFYAFGYIQKYTSPIYFYTLLSLMLTGMNGVILSGDLFNLYVFLEIASIASYALVAFGVEKEELEASFKYQVLGGLASLLILFSISLVYWLTGSLNMSDAGIIMRQIPENPVVLFTQIFFLVGFGLKAAIVPFHAWLPDAHSSAPSPISAMLSGILIKAIGVYVLIRLFFHVYTITIQVGWVITGLGLISIIIGGLLALGQEDYKRMLAYSSISQVGYVFSGFGLAMLVLASGGDQRVASLALFGGLFHLINHAIFKSLMFMVAGAVEHATGIRNLNQLGGLSSVMPITSASSLSGSLAISGLPPFGGFFSKLVIVIAAIQGGYYVIALIAGLMSIVTLAYFMRLQRSIFKGKISEQLRRVVPVPLNMMIPMILLAVLCLFTSVLMVPEVNEIAMSPVVDAILNNFSGLLTEIESP
jgi:multicomponent Na+:H+ antiporter subunit D